MLKTAEELRTLLIQKDLLILAEEASYEERAERLAKYRAYIDKLHVERRTLEQQLERLEAPLVKPTGRCVIEKMPNGQEWRV